MRSCHPSRCRSCVEAAPACGADAAHGHVERGGDLVVGGAGLGHEQAQQLLAAVAEAAERRHQRPVALVHQQAGVDAGVADVGAVEAGRRRRWERGGRDVRRTRRHSLRVVAAIHAADRVGGADAVEVLDQAQPHDLVDVGGVVAAEPVAAADGVHHAEVPLHQVVPRPLVALARTRDEVADRPSLHGRILRSRPAPHAVFGRQSRDRHAIDGSSGRPPGTSAAPTVTRSRWRRARSCGWPATPEQTLAQHADEAPSDGDDDERHRSGTSNTPKPSSRRDRTMPHPPTRPKARPSTVPNSEMITASHRTAARTWRRRMPTARSRPELAGALEHRQGDRVGDAEDGDDHRQQASSTMIRKRNESSWPPMRVLVLVDALHVGRRRTASTISLDLGLGLGHGHPVGRAARRPARRSGWDGGVVSRRGR